MGLGSCKVGANKNCGLFSPGALSIRFAKLHKKQQLYFSVQGNEAVQSATTRIIYQSSGQAGQHRDRIYLLVCDER